MKEPPELTTLRTLAGRVARAHGVAAYEPMWQLGFEILDELKNFGYHCTPVNSVAFGATGGDGIHLSLLTGEPLAGAVVITVPVGDIANTVVAESFGDFLRLGYHVGFEWLEELGYFDAAANQKYKEEPARLTDVSRHLLQEIRTTFKLVPYDDVAARLEELERHYAAHLRLPDPEE